MLFLVKIISCLLVRSQAAHCLLSSGAWNERERQLDATAASKEVRRCYQQGKTVSPAWFASHVACLSDCTGADSVRGTPGRPEGWAANRSTCKRCSQWHAVWAWMATDVPTTTPKTTLKTGFLFFFFRIFWAFYISARVNLNVRKHLSYYYERGKFSNISDWGDIDLACLPGSNSLVDTDTLGNLLPSERGFQ